MPFELVRDDLYVQFKLPPLCYVSSTRFFFPTSKCTSMNTPYKMFPVFFFENYWVMPYLRSKFILIHEEGQSLK